MYFIQLRMYLIQLRMYQMMREWTVNQLPNVLYTTANVLNTTANVPDDAWMNCKSAVECTLYNWECARLVRECTGLVREWTVDECRIMPYMIANVWRVGYNRNIIRMRNTLGSNGVFNHLNVSYMLWGKHESTFNRCCWCSKCSEGSRMVLGCRRLALYEGGCAWLPYRGVRTWTNSHLNLPPSLI